jgi:glycosyltransferase involved in cell wall biosynthesis
MSGSPRALLVTEQVDPGGKRSHVDALVAGLRAIGWDADCFDSGRLTLAERALVAVPNRLLETLRRGLGHRWIVPALDSLFARRLRGIAARRPPDVWHAQDPLTYRAVRRSAAGRPVALTVHGPVHREVASAYGLSPEDETIRWLRELETRAYREADAVISVDRAHADYVRSFGRTERLWVIPNFVDTRQFHPAAAPARLSGELETWIAGRPLLLCPRRLVPKNGVDIALRAAAVLSRRGIEAALLVAGTGPQRAELEALRRELGGDRFIALMGESESDAMPGWCVRAAIVLVPSVSRTGIEEATSISALEAQAAGRPVVASNLGGLREIIEHERTGMLVTPDDPEALADAVQGLLAAPAMGAAMGERACAAVREHHSHVAGARAYAAVYAALGVKGPA